MNKYSTCLHECGHALALIDFGYDVNLVNLDPPFARWTRKDPHTWDETVNLLVCVLAGEGAEYHWQGKPLSDLEFYGLDHYLISRVLQNWSQHDRKVLVHQAIQKTEKWLDQKFDMVQVLAKTLYRHGRLDQKDLKLLV